MDNAAQTLAAPRHIQIQGLPAAGSGELQANGHSTVPAATRVR